MQQSIILIYYDMLALTWRQSHNNIFVHFLSWAQTMSYTTQIDCRKPLFVIFCLQCFNSNSWRMFVPLFVVKSIVRLSNALLQRLHCDELHILLKIDMEMKTETKIECFAALAPLETMKTTVSQNQTQYFASIHSVDFTGFII